MVATNRAELLETVVEAIKNSELDCCGWSKTIQRELAQEIVDALEREDRLK